MDTTLLLRIEDAADDPEQYQVTVRAWPDGETLAADRVPRSLLPADGDDPLSVAAIRAHFATVNGEDPLFKQIGQHLFGLMAPGNLAEHLRPAAGAVQVMLDIRAASLRALPWELLQQNEKPVFNETGRAFLRGHPQAEPALPTFSWPLRILIVVGSGPGDTDVLAEQEVLGIVCALMPIEAQVDMRILKQPTAQEIVDQFKDTPDAFHPHILHFIGHGAAEDGESFLTLFDNDDPGSPKNWFANDIRGAFVSPWKPRLVFVNACRSNASKTGLWSVTEAFLDIGAAAVLGIHTDITGEHAVHFSVSFYEALAAGKSLEQAVAAGRGALWNTLSNAANRREWAAPSLEVRALPQEILHLDISQESDRWRQVRREKGFKHLRRLVDRHQERWDAWRGLNSQQNNVIVITGDPQIGKSAFTKQILERCSLCDMQVRYVDLINEERVDILTVLRRICDGEEGAGPLDRIKTPLPPAAFEPLRDKVRELFDSELTPELALREPHIPNPQDLDSLLDIFCQGLESVAKEGPLVIAIDHWDRLAQDQFEAYLYPAVLEWCWQRQNRDILVLLVMSLAEVQQFDMGYPTIELEGFRKSEWETLSWEFLSRLFEIPAEDQEHIQSMLEFSESKLGSKWNPRKLIGLETFGRMNTDWSVRKV